MTTAGAQRRQPEAKNTDFTDLNSSTSGIYYQSYPRNPWLKLVRLAAGLDRTEYDPPIAEDDAEKQIPPRRKPVTALLLDEDIVRD